MAGDEAAVVSEELESARVARAVVGRARLSVKAEDGAEIVAAGDVLFELGLLDEALDAYDLARAATPESAAGWFGTARVHLSFITASLEVAGADVSRLAQEGLGFSRRAGELGAVGDDFVRVHLMLLLMAQDYVKAAGFYDARVESGAGAPASSAEAEADMRFLGGFAYLFSGRIGEAEREFEAALDADGACVEAVYGMCLSELSGRGADLGAWRSRLSREDSKLEETFGVLAAAGEFNFADVARGLLVGSDC